MMHQCTNQPSGMRAASCSFQRTAPASCGMTSCGKTPASCGKTPAWRRGWEYAWLGRCWYSWRGRHGFSLGCRCPGRHALSFSRSVCGRCCHPRSVSWSSWSDAESTAEKKLPRLRWPTRRGEPKAALPLPPPLRCVAAVHRLGDAKKDMKTIVKRELCCGKRNIDGAAARTYLREKQQTDSSRHVP